jgi:malate dehydrogenase
MTQPPLYVRRPFLAGLIRQLPLLAVLVVVAIGLLLVTIDHWRLGLVVVGLALVGGAVLRLIPAPDPRGRAAAPRDKLLAMAAESRNGKVTVVGAGFYGSTTALRLAEYDIFETVVLTDIVEGKPEGIALDMNQSRPIEGFETKIVGVGGGSYEGTENSDVVVITAGLPRKPGMSRMDLIETNAKIVRQVAENIASTSPDAVVIVVSNPLDEMTALAQLATGFPKNRVMGQAGMLDTARFTNNVAEELGVPVGSVQTLTLGSHGDTMVPVPSRCTVDGKPLADVLAQDRIDHLVDRTRNGGAEVVALLKTGSAYYAPSAAAARMARAVMEDSGAVMPVCAWVDGEYGINGVYLGVEAEIGREGVKKVVEGDLTESELAGLREAAEAVRAKQADVADL